jgi:hypothetical protein
MKLLREEVDRVRGTRESIMEDRDTRLQNKAQETGRSVFQHGKNV